MIDSEPTEWEGDVFNRKSYATFLTNMLLNERSSFVLNIDASWGSGKTFFLEHWYDDIKKEHPAIFFNAWKTDYSQSPFISIVSSFTETLTEYLPEKQKEEERNKLYKKVGGIFSHTLPAITKSLVKNYVGEDGAGALSEIGEDVENGIAGGAEAIAKELIKGHTDTQINIDGFKAVLKNIIAEINKGTTVQSPLFVFIDELDRCRPTYAIELLETIKHLFNIDDVIFILATDTAQLASSVKSIYGESFSATTYLKRFFDQSYTLPPPSVLQFSEHLVKKHSYHERESFWVPIHHNDVGLYELEHVFAMISDSFDLKLRDQSQCFLRFHALTSTFNQGENIHVFFLCYLIVLHHIYGHTDFLLKIGKHTKKDSSLSFKRGGDSYTTQQLINVYSPLYTYDNQGVLNFMADNDPLRAHIAGTVYNQSKSTEKWYNILSKYPNLVLLAGSIH